TDDRGAVSEPGLVLDIHQADGPHKLYEEIRLLVVERRAAEAGDRHRAVDDATVLRRLLKGLVARLFDLRGDPLQRPVPALLLPLLASRRAVENFLQAPRVVHHLDAGGTLTAKRALADGMLGIAFDIDDAAVAGRDDLAAADAAERTDSRRLGRAFGFERRHRRRAARFRHYAERGGACGHAFEELAARRMKRPAVGCGAALLVISHSTSE